MSLLAPFEEAYRVLGIEGAADATAVKRAYRRATLEHPPDTDPEGFQRIRAAYELLSDPAKRAGEMLRDPLPHAAPPAPPAEVPPAPRGATALALLRLAVQFADTSTWLTTPPRRVRKKASP